MRSATRIVAHQAQAAHAIGLTSINLCAAARNDDNGNTLNGYYTWARCGFDAPLPYLYDRRQKYISFYSSESNVSRLTDAIGARISWLKEWPPELQDAKTVQDIMSKHEGKRWWKACPDGRDMVFDLHAGSLSWGVLHAYLVEKSVRI
jgi:hypothetical protein